jgi:NitT/TauT family transport system substrate-binding protein
LRALFTAVAALVLASAANAQTTVTIGTVLSVPSASTFIAMEKGYFREAGVTVKSENIDTLSRAMALLATNQMQLAQGGINAGYFNAVGQGLPIVMALESGSTPVWHNFLVRTDLKDQIKTAADLKGRNVAVSGPGSMSVYELGIILENVGLKMADVNVKHLAFPQMIPSLMNKSLDVALMVSPFLDQALAQGVAQRWIDPEVGQVKALPMTSLAYMASADWIRQNRAVAKGVIKALVRGGRDYCQAYHNGPNRGEVLDLMVRHGIAKDRDFLDKMHWQARSPDGALNPASIRDIYRLYKKEGLIEREPAEDKILDVSLAAEAAKELGPFELINTASPLPGCR